MANDIYDDEKAKTGASDNGQQPYDREFSNIAGHNPDLDARFRQLESEAKPPEDITPEEFREMGEESGARGAALKAHADQDARSAIEEGRANEEEARDLLNQFGFSHENSGLKDRAIHTAKNKFKKHKWLFAFGGVGTIGILLILVLIMLMIGSLIIPNFATHMEEYELSRVLRTFQERDLSVTAERAAADAADSSLSAKIKARYQNLRDNTWGIFDKYRPAKYVENLKTEGILRYNNKTGILGREGPLESVTINGVDYELNGGTFFNTFHPIQAFQQGAAVARAYAEEIGPASRGFIGTLVGGVGENIVRRELNIGLFAWGTGRLQAYLNKNQTDTAVLQDQDIYKATDDPTAAGKDPGTLGSTESAASAAEADCVNKPECLKGMVESGATEPKVAVDAVLKGVDGTLMGKILGFLQSLVNPAIGILFQICMINAGSMVNSSPNIDAQDAELQRTFYYVASAADQQKYGNVNSEAAGALANKFGDLANADIEKKASGIPINTSSYISSQASKAGQYTDTGILSVLSGPTVGKVATTVCNAFLSPGGIALTTIAGILAAAGGDEALNGVSTVVKEIVSNVVNQFTTKAGLKAFLGKTLRDGAIAVGGAILAKMIVINSLGAYHNGLSKDTSFDNDATAGADLNNSEVMQKEFYGVPMNDSDTAQVDMEDSNYTRGQIASESVSQRYFAISNPDSFLSNVALSLYGMVYGKQLLPSVMSLASKIFDPFAAIPRIFTTLSSKAALAATAENTSASQHYGIVQWGYTPAEEALINGTTSQVGNQSFGNGKGFKFAASSTDSRISYQMLENGDAFTNEWNDYHKRTGGDLEADIQKEYGACYTDSMGELLSSGMIVRDANGNVLENKGLCSEANLGPNNNFDSEPQSVFRWRVMHSYNATTNNLTQAQAT